MEDKGQYKEIFNQSPVGILFFDRDGKLSDADQLALEIGGIQIG